MMKVSPNEVMLVREFNGMEIFRYSNDAVAQREMNQTCLKAIFVVKFDVNEGKQLARVIICYFLLVRFY